MWVSSEATTWRAITSSSSSSSCKTDDARQLFWLGCTPRFGCSISVRDERPTVVLEMASSKPFMPSSKITQYKVKKLVAPVQPVKFQLKEKRQPYLATGIYIDLDCRGNSKVIGLASANTKIKTRPISEVVPMLICGGLMKLLPKPISKLSSPSFSKNPPETQRKVDATMKSTPESRDTNHALTLKRPESAASHAMKKLSLESPPAVSATQRSDKGTILPSSSTKAVAPNSTKSGKPQKHDQSVFVSTHFVAKMKTKQVKGMITGVGKELRRAANSIGDTLSDKIPNPTKKKNKAEKEKQELMGNGDPQKPQLRNPDEIKKAYGHATDASHSAGMARERLRERGEKLSAIQRRTAELEADAANFQSLTQELVKKMENKKWYEI